MEHKCQLTDCTSGLPATLSPVILLYAPKSYGNHTPVRTSTTLEVCIECSKKMTVEGFLNAEGWSRVMAGFFKCGKVLPDRSRSKLAFETIAHREIQFEIASKSKNVVEA